MNLFPSNVLERSNVQVSGRGPQTVVLLHCFGGSQHMWQGLLPPLEARYQVVLLDLVDCGGPGQTTYQPERHGTLRSHADDLLAVLRALALHDVVFVGHSISAMIGVLAASQEPERFARLVLVSPSPRFVNGSHQAPSLAQQDLCELLGAVENDYLGWSETLLPLVAAARQAEPVMELSNSFMRTNPEIARHFARVACFADMHGTGRLSFLSIPTLIVQAAHDVLTPLAMGHYLHTQLPNSEVVIIDTCGHSPHVSAPTATLAAISDFLHRSVL